MPSRRDHGFTIIELLIVITLIAILSVIGFIGYRLQLAKSFDALRKRDLNNLRIAFEHYFSDHACYPASSILNNCGGNQLLPYLEKIPCDPETKLPYAIRLDPTIGCATKFFIFADLANTSDPQITCNQRYIVSSPNSNTSELSLACVGQSFCRSGYYACVQGTCTLISVVTRPACSPLFCASNCQNSCSLPGWEVDPQPCLP